MSSGIVLSEKFIECLEATMSESLEEMFQGVSESRIHLSDVIDRLGHLQDALKNPGLYQDLESGSPPTLEDRLHIFLALFHEVKFLVNEAHDSWMSGFGDLPECACLAERVIRDSDD